MLRPLETPTLHYRNRYIKQRAGQTEGQTEGQAEGQQTETFGCQCVSECVCVWDSVTVCLCVFMRFTAYYVAAN